MYCEFYQLTERPFNVTPDPKFLYLNARYREAIASLNYGITQRKGFITLIGEAGTGKTTLLNKLLEDLDPKTKSVFIFNTNVTFEEILEYIFAEFDLPVHNGKKLYMLQRLNSFLLEELRGGGNVALLIDEAQDLEFSVLEDLRLLSNLETAKEKILQIVLSGQPELGQKLSNPVLRQLRQRIGINCRLLPLSRDEITEYIQYRLQAAGCPDLKLFSREAEDQIYNFSRGIPRLVNVVCDNALVIGYALGKKRIGADVITEAAADLLAMEGPAEEPVAERPMTVSSSPSPLPPKTQSRWRSRFGVMGLVMVAVVVGLLSVGRTMLYRRGDELPPHAPAPQQFEVIKPGSQPQGAGVEVPPMRPVERANNPLVEWDDVAPPDSAPATNGDVVAQEHVPPAKAAVARRADTAFPGDASVEIAVAAKAKPDHLARTYDEPTATQPSEPQVIGARPGGAPADSHSAERALEHISTARNVEVAAVAPVEIEKPVPPGAARAKATSKNEAANAVAALRAPEPEIVRPDDSAVADHAEAAPSEPEGGQRLDGVQFARVIVHGGDSISVIALRKYGQASATILDLLKLANPEVKDIDLISVGQTIRLPELGEGYPILNDGTGHYALLVFSTPNAVRATALQNALRGRGFDAHVSGASVGLQRSIFRVVVSGFTDREEVASVGKQLQKLFREDPRFAQLGE